MLISWPHEPCASSGLLCVIEYSLTHGLSPLTLRFIYINIVSGIVESPWHCSIFQNRLKVTRTWRYSCFFFFQSYYFNFLWRSWEENIAMTSEFLVLATIHIVNTRYVFNSRGYDFANTQLRTRKQLFCLIQRFSLTSRVMKLNSTRCGESFVAWKKNRLVESRKMETEFLFLPFKVEQSATGYKIATARTEFEYNFTETPTTELLCFKSSKHPSQVYI